jgi:hypothetical protein
VENTPQVKLTFPVQINHSDNEIAFIPNHPLLKYEQDERLRQFYLENLEHLWQIKQPERNPL